MKILTENEALYKAATYCSMTEHCQSEVLEKLAQWGINDIDIRTRIIQHLQKENYINDIRFCNFFVNDKFRFNKWGRKKIAIALNQKNLPESIISDALNLIDEEEYKSVLQSLLSAKKKTIKGNNEYEKYNKLLRFAFGRGFEISIIKQVINTPDEMEFE